LWRSGTWIQNHEIFYLKENLRTDIFISKLEHKIMYQIINGNFFLLVSLRNFKELKKNRFKKHCYLSSQLH
jgi:hypothetical protein